MTEVSFEVSDTIDDRVDAAVDAGLLNAAAAKGIVDPQEKDLCLTVLGPSGEVAGGLIGKSCWGWVFLKYLWVDPPLQGQGVGTKLVKLAEEEGLRRGCHVACVYTHSFQAPQFYPKLGYKEFVVMQDFPVGHQRIGFMKKLGEAKGEEL